jgi:aryl carrier-like protein
MTTTDIDERLAGEQTLVEVFAGVLNEAVVAPEANFFSLGGDSLLAATLVARARRAGLAISLHQLLRHPTPRGLAAVASICTAAPAPPRAIGNADREAPLLPFQHDWLGDGAGRADPFVLGVLAESRQPLDPDALEAALGAVVAHHDGLRLRLTRVRGVWRQRVVARERASLLAVASLPVGSEGETALVQEHAYRLASSVDVTEGPLVRAILFPGAGVAPDRLLLAVHHFGIDPVSFAVLMEDLETAYGQLRAGQRVVLPPAGTSVVDLAHLLATRWKTPAGRAEADYWAAQSTRVPPLDPRRPRTTVADRSGTTSIELPAGTNAALRDHRRAGSLGGRGPEIALGTLAYAFRRVTGRARFLARLTHHGRTQLPGQVDLSHTIGWLTTQIPVVVDMPDPVDPVDAVRATNSALAAAPGGGLGYFALAQWLPGPDGDRIRHIRRGIDFNVNLQREAAAVDDTMFTPCQTQPQFFRGHSAGVPSLALYGNEEVGGPAIYTWRFDPRVHDAAVVADLAEVHRTALVTIAQSIG